MNNQNAYYGESVAKEEGKKKKKTEWTLHKRG